MKNPSPIQNRSRWVDSQLYRAKPRRL